MRPESRSFLGFLQSIFYDPHWNEALFILDSAERLLLEGRAELAEEINNRIQTELYRRGFDLTNYNYLQFRLLVQDEELIPEAMQIKEATEL